jgi:hypothetical protein
MQSSEGNGVKEAPMPVETSKAANSPLATFNSEGRYLELEFDGSPPTLKRLEFRYNKDWHPSKLMRSNGQLHWPKVKPAISICFLKYAAWHLSKNQDQFLFGSEEQDRLLAKSLSGAIFGTGGGVRGLFSGHSSKTKEDDPTVIHRVFPAIAGNNKGGRSNRQPVTVAVSKDFLPPKCVRLVWDVRGPEPLTDLKDIHLLTRAIRESLDQENDNNAGLRGTPPNVSVPDHAPKEPARSEDRAPTDESLIIPAIQGLAVEGWNDGVECHQTNLYSKWLNWLSGFTFDQLLSHHRVIELQLRYNLQRSVRRLLLHQGWHARKPSLVRGKVGAEPLFDPTSMSPECREPKLQIRPDQPSKMSLWPGKEIHVIGSIRQITLEYPSKQGINAPEIVGVLTSEIETAYHALEEIFILKAEKMSKVVFSNIYNCLHAALKLRHGFDRGKELVDQCWCCVGDGQFTVYFFCGESLRATAQRLKHPLRQHQFRSPFNMLCALVVQPFPFESTFSRIAAGMKKPLHSTFVKAGYIHTAQAAYDAEVALYSASDFSVHVCKGEGNMMLSVACPRPVTDDVMPEIVKLERVLVRQLNEALKEWSPHISNVSLIAKKTMPHLNQFG